MKKSQYQKDRKSGTWWIVIGIVLLVVLAPLALGGVMTGEPGVAVVLAIPGLALILFGLAKKIPGRTPTLFGERAYFCPKCGNELDTKNVAAEIGDSAICPHCGASLVRGPGGFRVYYDFEE